MQELSILSLGAGVQSSCLALMVSKGEYKPKYSNIHSIFADVGWEPQEIYDWLSELENNLEHPVHRVQRRPTKHCSGNLYNDLMNLSSSTTDGMPSPPLYLLNKNGKKGMLPRQCTTNYKILPIQQKIRELLGYSKGQRVKECSVECMLGISYDEQTRMNQSNLKYIENTFPLVELKMTRRDCLDWLLDNGFGEPKRSACIGCPYRSTDEWLDMKSDPIKWNNAIKLDESIRDAFKGDKKVYLHRSCQPLKDIEFKELDESHAISFLDECSGLCGN